jgi:hypothetical protein
VEGIYDSDSKNKTKEPSESDASSNEKWKMPLLKMQKLERSNYYAVFLSNTMEIIVIHV